VGKVVIVGCKVDNHILKVVTAALRGQKVLVLVLFWMLVTCYGA
jgi:hypothetical protein